MSDLPENEYIQEFQRFAAVVDCLELLETINTPLDWFSVMAEDLVGVGKTAEAISGLTKEIREFFSKLFGPAGEEAGALLADQIKFWRFRNSVRIAEEAKKILDDKGIEPRAVSPKILIPLLESASLEDTEALRAKWAKLLARAGAGYTVHPGYSRILSELSPDEVGILDVMDSSYKQDLEPRNQWITNGFKAEPFMQQFSLSKDQFERACDNLFRLRLCQPIAGGSSIGDAPIAVVHYDIITMTPLGWDFSRACSGP